MNSLLPLFLGAFGEVFHGYYLKTDNKNDVMHKKEVAVKTLPEFVTNKKAEIDFITEALLMSSKLNGISGLNLIQASDWDSQSGRLQLSGCLK